MPDARTMKIQRLKCKLTIARDLIKEIANTCAEDMENNTATKRAWIIKKSIQTLDWTKE